MPYFIFSPESKKNYRHYEILIKYILESLASFNFNSINKDKVMSDTDFEIIYGQFIPCVINNDFDNFVIFYQFYTKILDLFFNRQFKSNNPNINLIYILWSRIVQIKEFKESDYIKEKSFASEINDRYNKLISKYPQLKEIEKTKIRFPTVFNIDLKNLFDIS
jgi:hypothetical protein